MKILLAITVSQPYKNNRQSVIIMSEHNQLPPDVHTFLSNAGKKGAASLTRKDRVAGGIAGSKSRWSNRPLCPACFKPATKAQIKAKEFVTKAQLESRKNVS